MLEQLSRADVPLSELRKPFERYMQSGEINTRVEDPAAVIEQVAAAYAESTQDRLDGLTVDFGDWWFNLRPSNTEPLLRLNLEAADAAACDAHTAEVLALVAASSLASPTLATTRRSRAWRWTRSCSRSSRAPRTRARCSTSRTRQRSTTRGCKRRYRVLEATSRSCSIDEAETVDDAEAARLEAKAAADGIEPTFSRNASAMAVDSLGFVDAVAGLPEQLAAAHEAGGKVSATALPDAARIRNIVTLGMGGRASPATSCGRGTATLPACRSPCSSTPHARVRRTGTLAFALSYSGDTEETVSMALERGSRGARNSIAVSRGGAADEASRTMPAPCTSRVPR